MNNTFVISATSDHFWNKDEFFYFLHRHAQQKIKLKINPEAICLTSLGVYDILEQFDFTDVEIHTSNPLEQHDKFKIHVHANQWLREPQPDRCQEFHCWNQQKVFLALYSRPTAARLTLASYLQTYHNDQTHLHFSMNTDDNNLLHFELDKSLYYDKSSIQRIGRLVSQMPVLLSHSGLYTTTNGYNYADPLTQLYKDILVDVVVESHVTGTTFFPTEKTLRPMWLKKPFVVFSNYDYLLYLRQMGFKTFNDFWDEDYDGFETKDRLHRIYQVLDYISRLGPDQTQDMYRQMQHILDHNFDMLNQKTFLRKINKSV
jgi:hypothetical protein